MTDEATPVPSERRTNRLLGYPDAARLLIINAADFGMCHAVSEAVKAALTAGVVSSTTVMSPCPWAPDALHWLAAHPEIPFEGIVVIDYRALQQVWRR